MNRLPAIFLTLTLPLTAQAPAPAPEAAPAAPLAQPITTKTAEQVSTPGKPPATNVTRGEISHAGARLAALYDSLDVGHHWLPGRDANWVTGEPIGGYYHHPEAANNGSSFVAGACKRLGVPMPPSPSADNQLNWLVKNGGSEGWTPLASPFDAQQRANEGQIVVAGYSNTLEYMAGVIALVRPSTKALQEIQREGPQVIHAGSINANSTSSAMAFRDYRQAWHSATDFQVRFFAHPAQGSPESGGKAIPAELAVSQGKTPTPVDIAPVAEAPQFSEAVTTAIGPVQEGRGRLVFFRPSRVMGALIGFIVREQDEELGKLRNGKYFVISAEPGKHTYTVHSETTDSLTIEVEEGETYFFAGSLSLGFLVGHPHLNPSDAAAFTEALPSMDSVTPLVQQTTTRAAAFVPTQGMPPATRGEAGKISQAGVKLAAAYDALDVEHHWLPGRGVNLVTGQAIVSSYRDINVENASAFVAGACKRLGVSIPPSPDVNSQLNWLIKHGESAGWTPLTSPLDAQQRANGGQVVVAGYSNTLEYMNGLVALVRPSTKPEHEIQLEGPQVIHAGRINANSTSSAKAFQSYRQAWHSGTDFQIRFFAYTGAGAPEPGGKAMASDPAPTLPPGSLPQSGSAN